jgi:hypothetical protein
VHRAIVNVGRHGFNALSVVVGAGVSLHLLLIANIICLDQLVVPYTDSTAPLTLRTSLDALFLSSNDGLFEHNTRQVRIRREAFPVPPAVCRSSKWSSDGSKHYMSSFLLELLSEVLASLMSQLAIPRCCHSETGRED